MPPRHQPLQPGHVDDQAAPVVADDTTFDDRSAVRVKASQVVRAKRRAELGDTGDREPPRVDMTWRTSLDEDRPDWQRLSANRAGDRRLSTRSSTPVIVATDILRKASQLVGRDGID